MRVIEMGRGSGAMGGIIRPSIPSSLASFDPPVYTQSDARPIYFFTVPLLHGKQRRQIFEERKQQDRNFCFGLQGHNLLMAKEYDICCSPRRWWEGAYLELGAVLALEGLSDAKVEHDSSDPPGMA